MTGEQDQLDRRPWTQIERDALSRLWFDGVSCGNIAQRIGRSRDAVKSMRRSMKLPERISPFIIKKINTREFYFNLPVSRGLQKLLNRSDTLIEWVTEGRDNYELARAFHVPMADVVRAVRGLRLVRPAGLEPETELTRDRNCSACGHVFPATKYRFRCDPCLNVHAKYDDTECVMRVSR